MLSFTKMHGCGNDYVYMDCTQQLPENPSALAIQVSDRHLGIGGDGLILIASSEVADFRMIMFNADGSEGSMCGNGIRCVGKYVYDKGLTDQTSLRIETKSGIKYLNLTAENGKVSLIQVDMGKPTLVAESIPVVGYGDRVVEQPISVAGYDFLMTCVSVGNPHAVLWVDDVDTCPLETVGPLLEFDPCFPERANIEFIQVVDDHTIRMRVWERGSGETLACGTGACASAFACYTTGKTGPRVTVHLRGGDLQIDCNAANGNLQMTGPAVTVFDCTYSA